MAEVLEERAEVRQRKRIGGKPAPRGASPRQNRTLVLSDDTWEKLGVGAGRRRMDRSAYAEELLRGPLRRFVVQDRGGLAPEEVSAIQAIEVKDSGETLPIGEAVTASEAVSGDPSGGEGEGLDAVAKQPRRRRA